MQIEKRIAIIEVDYHPEVVRNTLMIFNELPVFCEIFITKKIWDLVGITEELSFIRVHIIPPKQNMKVFFEQKLQVINSCDFVFFYTLETQYKVFNSLRVSPPVVLLVHNTNAFFRPQKSLYPRLNYFYIRKDIPYIILHVLYKFDLYYRHHFLKNKVSHFCFPSLQIVEHVRANNILPPKKVLPPFRLVYSKYDTQNLIDKERVSIAIIGQIDCRRRDYLLVYRAFKQFTTKLKQPVEIKLLGRPVGNYGKRVIRKFKQLENDFFKVTCSKTFIRQNEFDNHIKQSHFFIVPVYTVARHKLFKEIYGRTKISGNINDMIMHGKPALIPDSYPLPHLLNKVSRQFNGVDELARALQLWIETKEYLDFDYLEIKKYYSLENMAKNTRELINCVVQPESN